MGNAKFSDDFKQDADHQITVRGYRVFSVFSDVVFKRINCSSKFDFSISQTYHNRIECFKSVALRNF